ncbi:hypothetical protein [Parabacteroides sp. Marseille-P3160]|uniref:hypothetical protein n=1 Tax=Parabacteroides sp. Marseille-P3160 TaxID=1917887 RepID=UPI0009BBCB79|nr:hypothetical protein [Parabacteroides sp. Marseille-P3160]
MVNETNEFTPLLGGVPSLRRVGSKASALPILKKGESLRGGSLAFITDRSWSFCRTKQEFKCLACMLKTGSSPLADSIGSSFIHLLVY